MVTLFFKDTVYEIRLSASFTPNCAISSKETTKYTGKPALVVLTNTSSFSLSVISTYIGKEKFITDLNTKLMLP